MKSSCTRCILQTLLDHEVHRSRRYKTPLTLIHLAIGPILIVRKSCTAEMFTINILTQLRDRYSMPQGNEFRY
jgi:hypothetical protein